MKRRINNSLDVGETLFFLDVRCAIQTMSTQARLRYMSLVAVHKAAKYAAYSTSPISLGFGSIVPAYDIVYIAQLGFGNREFRNYLIGLYTMKRGNGKHGKEKY